MENYRKLKTLGRGRYGEVWLVEREDSGLAAIKRIPCDEDQPNWEEVRVLEKLHHQHIIQYHESFVENNYLYIVMDYAEGGDLSARIRIARENKFYFTEAQIWKWFYQLSMALSYIHSLKIIHRDLKTKNIFLTKDGGLQLGDFGFSKVLQFSDEMAYSGVGTAYYLAPEICKGEGYDAKADVWSLGCVLYELCTLNHPFEAENIAVLANSIIKNDPEQIPDSFSENLRNLIFQLLRKDKNERPSINQILEEVELKVREDRAQTFSKKGRKSYQKEMSINIPTEQRNVNIEPSSAKQIELSTATHMAARKSSLDHPASCSTSHASQRTFSFSQSLLKQSPGSPVRTTLMSDFLRRRLGDQNFERICQILSNTKDPAKLLQEQPWIVSDICGEENLSIVDVGITFNAFNTQNPTSVKHQPGRTRVFPLLLKKIDEKS
ncbi:unnamed protein product [Blepharisma stoltei]|uniref:non-specific serine/threonine protein kinase n=1 Tax=Blepharisma stoltei TaxID=1481888 RepID=A0AAU9IXF5_9CILI|nr:unnamed protein product [Blepharisma stoltei]